MRTLPPRARLFLIAVSLAGASIGAWVALAPTRVPLGSWRELAILALLAFVAGGKKLRVIGLGKHDDEDGSLSLGFVFILAAIVRGGPLHGFVVAVLSCLSSCIFPKVKSPHQLIFNLSLTAIQSWLAGLVYLGLNGGTLVLDTEHSLVAAVIATVVYFSINSAGVAGIIALCSGRSVVSLWWNTLIGTAPPYIAGGLIIPLVMIFSRGHVGLVLLFGVPISLLTYQSYAASFALANERQRRIGELEEREARLAVLYETAEHRARQQKSLSHLGVLALSEMDADRWLQETAETVVRTLGSDTCAIMEQSETQPELHVRGGSGWSPGTVGRSLPGGLESLAGYTVLNRTPITIQDLPGETLFRPGPLLEEHGLTSGATCLIHDAGNRVWGVLGAYSREKRDFSPENVAYLQSVANVISLVLDRFRHVELADQHTQEIDGLNVRLQRAMAETHHRVKNNLQVVSALVDIQLMDGTPNIPSTELYRLGQHVRSLAAIHDLLTQEAKADATGHFLSTRKIMDNLIPLVRGLVGARPLRYSADDTLVSPQLGTSLAVLLNELVSNAVKHGQGEIEISLAFTGQNGQLMVSDRGPGFPNGFNSAAAAHTGLELVESLSRWDLQGEPRYENREDGGARVVVKFPLQHEITAVVSGKHPVLS